MKQLNNVRLYLLVMLAAFASITSCKKEIQPNVNINEVANSTSPLINENPCKPVVFGATIGYPGIQNRWVTLMQKWYGAYGRPMYLKARFYSEMDNFSMLEHSIEWGMLTYYNGNQVYLTVGSDTVMRVTLDSEQRPAASYYHHDHFPKGSYLIDTCYYHFTGNRLVAVERLYVDSYGGRSRFEKYSFSYDQYGNLLRIDTWNPNKSEMMFVAYDYSKPVGKMISIMQVTIPFKLLEYMELLNFPILHEITGVVGLGNNWQLNNYSFTSPGLVSSYEAVGLHERKFYTGWDCSISSGVATAPKNFVALDNIDDFRSSFTNK